jgi:hypothetical protein
MTRMVYESAKVRFHMSSSAGEPTVKAPPWIVKRVGRSAGEVRSWWEGKNMLLGVRVSFLTEEDRVWLLTGQEDVSVLDTL